MCGILGMLRYNGVGIDPRVIAQGASILRHRGPDGDGYVLINTASGASDSRIGDDPPPGITFPHWSQPSAFPPDLILA